MKRTNRHIAILLIPIIAMGIIFSLTHYHGESMKCLYHVDDQHFTQNDLVCPVCAVFAADLGLAPASGIIPGQAEFIQPACLSHFSTKNVFHFSLRAPPVPVNS